MRNQIKICQDFLIIGKLFYAELQLPSQEVGKIFILKYGFHNKSFILNAPLVSCPNIKSKAVCSYRHLLIGTFDGAVRCAPGDTKCTLTYASLRTYCSTFYNGP